MRGIVDIAHRRSGVRAMSVSYYDYGAFAAGCDTGSSACKAFGRRSSVRRVLQVHTGRLVHSLRVRPPLAIVFILF